MEAWDGWSFDRIYLLVVAAAFVLIGGQVFLFHWRAAFHKWTMYGPVLLAPVVVAAGIVGAAVRDGWLGWAVLSVFALGIADGAVGVFEHFRGIAARIGGFSLRNVMSGPPPFLPMAFLALSASGLLALLWQSL
jgi:hypothetical protein